MDSVCEPARPMPAMDPSLEQGDTVWIGREIFDRHSVTFETTRAGRGPATYRIDGLYVRPPDDDLVCDCGDSVLLLPTADGRLVRR